MGSIGRHLIAELFECRAERLNDLHAVTGGLTEAADHAEVQEMTVACHQVTSVGISGVLMNATAHLSIHTWPAYRYAALDVFSCADGSKADQAVAALARHFGAERVSLIALRRGQFIRGTGPSNGTGDPVRQPSRPPAVQVTAAQLQAAAPVGSAPCSTGGRRRVTSRRIRP